MIVGYIRVSSRDARTHEAEIATQKHKILAYARQGVDSWFIDAGVSGKTDPMARPSFAEMVAECEDADVEVRVIASERSRYGRGAAALDAARLALLEDVEHVSMEDASGATHEIEVIDPSDWLLDQIMTVFSEYERRVIVARLAAGKERAKAEGRHMGGNAPYGFEIDAGVLVRNEKEFDMAQRIVETLESGVSIRKTADKLNIKKSTVESVAKRKDLFK